MKKQNMVVKLFIQYYKNVYEKWRINKEKAGKDIVGEEYEKFRKTYYESKGFECQTHVDFFNIGVNIDNVISFNGEVKIFEEAKGSYVDGTFLKRAIVDAATVFKHCIDNTINFPYFILSCPTKMNNYEETYKKIVSLLNSDLKNIMDKNFIYIPLCEHGRIPTKKYFKTDESNFKLSETLIEQQEKIIEKIKKSL
jgi:hypothetical protein